MGVRGWHHLKDADLMIIGTRFRQPNPGDAKHITNFLNDGKPVIGIRTSTHAFTGNGNFGGKIPFGKFGPDILGEGWGKPPRENIKLRVPVELWSPPMQPILFSPVLQMFSRPRMCMGLMH